MTKREKVINGLECWSNGARQCNNDCPYRPSIERMSVVGVCDIPQLSKDALELLKEREPRVMTLDEAFDLQTKKSYPCIFVDEKNRKDVFLAVINDELYGDYHSDDFKVYRPWAGASKAYRKIEYGKSIRFWNEFPTDAQREAVKWE